METEVGEAGGNCPHEHLGRSNRRQFDVGDDQLQNRSSPGCAAMTGDAPKGSPSGHDRFRPRLLVAVALAVLAVIFMAENTAKVKIRAIAPSITVPLWQALFSTLILGMLILALAQRRHRHR